MSKILYNIPYTLLYLIILDNLLPHFFQNVYSFPFQSQNKLEPIFDTTVVRDFLVMQDGVKLSVTYTFPLPGIQDSEDQEKDTKFPVLLNYLPYRKDNSFYIDKYKYGIYFAKHGFIHAMVDIRGTGSSEGHLIWKEYSDAELEDGIEIIQQFSNGTWNIETENGNRTLFSNGNVGMHGMSWGAFNALMLAAKNPPGLKTILAVHGSEDLAFNDIHYLDGIYHQDEYIASVDHENALPQAPDMILDEVCFILFILLLFLMSLCDNLYIHIATFFMSILDLHFLILIVAGYSHYRFTGLFEKKIFKKTLESDLHGTSTFKFKFLVTKFCKI